MRLLLLLLWLWLWWWWWWWWWWLLLLLLLLLTWTIDGNWHIKLLDTRKVIPLNWLRRKSVKATHVFQRQVDRDSCFLYCRVLLGLIHCSTLLYRVIRGCYKSYENCHFDQKCVCQRNKETNKQTTKSKQIEIKQVHKQNLDSENTWANSEYMWVKNLKYVEPETKTATTIEINFVNKTTTTTTITKTTPKQQQQQQKTNKTKQTNKPSTLECIRIFNNRRCLNMVRWWILLQSAFFY